MYFHVEITVTRVYMFLVFGRARDIQQTHFLFNGDGSVKPTLLGPPPQIKILKRPQHNGTGHGHHRGPHTHDDSQGKPKQQVKTLQQVSHGFFFSFSETEGDYIGEMCAPLVLLL